MPMHHNVCGEIRSAGGGLGNDNKNLNPILKSSYSTQENLFMQLRICSYTWLMIWLLSLWSSQGYSQGQFTNEISNYYPFPLFQHGPWYWLCNIFMWEVLHTHAQKPYSFNFKWEKQWKIKRTFLPDNFKLSYSRMWADITKQ